MLDTAVRTDSAVLAPGDETQLNAYNAAFCELELSWRWDARTYHDLLSIAEEKGRICAYLQRHQAHLLRAYEVGFLCELIYDTKVRCFEELSRPTPNRQYVLAGSLGK